MFVFAIVHRLINAAHNASVKKNKKIMKQAFATIRAVITLGVEGSDMGVAPKREKRRGKDERLEQATDSENALWYLGNTKP